MKLQSFPTTKKPPSKPVSQPVNNDKSRRRASAFSVDDEPEAIVTTTKIKKKSKSSTTALAIVQPYKDMPVVSTPASDAEIEQALKSKFGEKSDVILQMLELGEDDGAVTLILRSLLQMMVSILPVVEHPVRTSHGARGIHGFNMTVSQMRELIADVQAVRDKGMLGQHIVERHVRPAFMDIAVQIVTALSRLEASARPRMEKDDYQVFSTEMLEIKSGLANYIQTQYKEVSDSVVKSLS